LLTSNHIRSGFIDFFRERGHEFVPSAPLIPIGDETLMFINAGMNQFKDIFLGLSAPSYKRAANSQKCIRVSGKHNDLEQVGLDTYHHTFFEMLGNWSFDDYFKAESIEWAWELLTKVYGIDGGLLWATVFAGDGEDGSAPDEEAEELWKKLTPIPAERILRFGKKDNFWEMGSTGPCGPCSEIHIDLGPNRCDMKHVAGHKCEVNAGCARFIELWNLVFIQFNREADGKLVRLGANYVDTGAGLERIASVLQNKKSNYDTDLFMPIINAIADLTGHKYTSQLGSDSDNAFRVIADHIRSLTFAITDGVTPSNEGRGYVMRRILRRAARFGRLLDAHEPFMYKLVDVVAEQMGDAFGEVKERAEFVATVIEAEEASFGKTLDRGLEIFTSAAESARESKNKTISGDDAFELYDTYGFPLDLTELMARERSLGVDTDRFDELMAQQRQRGRAAQKSSFISLVAATLTGVELPRTDDSPKYESNECECKLLGYVIPEKFVTEGDFSDTNTTIGVVLDKTCFYAEAGGQVGDCGVIEGLGWTFDVEMTEKIADCVIHRGKLRGGIMLLGEDIPVTAKVDKLRNKSRKNHTATHLLQWALQEVLGESVRQQGSLVCPDYLRFDFTYPKALKDAEKKRVEELVRGKIADSEPITCTVMPIEDAKKLGAMALFGEKYGSEVRVVAVGAENSNRIDDAFSREFCGGTHVDNTSDIGGFLILKEESISAGVRRITALTGEGLMKHLLKRSEIVDELSALLKAPDEQIVERVGKLLEDNKKLAKELKTAAKRGGSDIMSEVRGLLERAERIGDAVVVVGVVSAGPIEQARSAIDMVKKKARSAAVVVGMAEDEDKVTLLSGVTEDLVKKGVKAGDIVKEIAPIVGGGGGGRAGMAQAGGKDPSKIDEALEKAREFIKAKLADIS
jgi:alanyl-tRNA synthetase